MKSSIFTKIFISYIAVISLVSILILGVTFTTVKKHYIADRIHELKRVESVLRPEISSLIDQKRYGPLNALLKRTDALQRMRLTVIKPDGRVIADSVVTVNLLENHRTRPEIAVALKGRVGTSIRLSTTVHKDMLYVAIPLWRGTTISAVLRSSVYMETIDQVMREIQLQSILLSSAFIFLALWLTSFLIRRFTEPLRELSRATHTIAAGNFDARVPLFEDEEVRELSLNFNDMADQVKRSFEEVSRQKEELQLIIASMQEGMIMISTEGVILLSNSSFCAMIKDDHPEKKYYWEYIRNDEFGAFLKRIHQERKACTRELQVGARIYLISGAVLNQSSDCVVMFRDVTEAKDLERIKRDFVVNVSHELRTPLTAIKGFVEALQVDSAPEQRRYLDIIASHTERLIAIVQDLLTLSELEEKGIRLNYDQVDVVELIHNLHTLFEQRLRIKSLGFVVRASGVIPKIKADAFKLEQAFINLIDNAIKYSEKGEIRIDIVHTENMVTITVSDSGIGIAPEVLPRIFERFYVVDKSRSRKSGGTGLGLSIVKHIVLLHNGTIDVKSTVGVGTHVIVSLPVSR